jgi:hypothetical protein
MSSEGGDSRIGRRRSAVQSYSENQLVYDSDVPWEGLTLEERLEQLHVCCTQLGFNSIFEASLSEAKTPTGFHDTNQHMREFAQNGQFSAFINTFRESGSFNVRGRPVSGVNILPGLSEYDVCAMSETVYLREWDDLRKLDVFNVPIYESNINSLLSFNFTTFYESVSNTAPHLLLMLERLSVSRDVQTIGSKHRRYLVFMLASLANLRNKHLVHIQGIIGLYLYASKTPKRVIGNLNHLGASISASSVRNMVAELAKSAWAELRKVGSLGIAFQLSFDNLTLAEPVRDATLFNFAGFLNYSSGYVLIPHPAKQRPMFKRAVDLKLWMVPKLGPFDFFPREHDNRNMQLAFKSMLFDTLQRFAKFRRIKIGDIRYPMPEIHQIDHRYPPRILTLPTYDLDESKIAETIDILNEIQEDIGLSDQQRRENLILYKGDFMTGRNTRYPALGI